METCDCFLNLFSINFVYFLESTLNPSFQVFTFIFLSFKTHFPGHSFVRGILLFKLQISIGVAVQSESDKIKDRIIYRNGTVPRPRPTEWPLTDLMAFLPPQKKKKKLLNKRSSKFIFFRPLLPFLVLVLWLNRKTAKFEKKKSDFPKLKYFSKTRKAENKILTFSIHFPRKYFGCKGFSILPIKLLFQNSILSVGNSENSVGGLRN